MAVWTDADTTAIAKWWIVLGTWFARNLKSSNESEGIWSIVVKRPSGYTAFANFPPPFLELRTASLGRSGVIHERHQRFAES